MWPRVGGLRALELGTPGGLRLRLNSLVLEGRKRATAGLLREYVDEGEAVEHVGERLALLDDEGVPVATVEITDVEHSRFGEVPWEFAAAEGEGDADIEDWREGHRRYWTAQGTPVDHTTEVVLLRFAVVPDAGVRGVTGDG